MKFLKANPKIRIEESIPEKPLFHACCGEHGYFGELTLDSDILMRPMILGDVNNLPIKNNTYASAYMDCPWTAPWKRNIACAMKELLRVAPVVYVLSPWTYGSHTCKITSCQVAWTPGINQALLFCRYERN